MSVETRLIFFMYFYNYENKGAEELFSIRQYTSMAVNILAKPIEPPTTKSFLYSMQVFTLEIKQTKKKSTMLSGISKYMFSDLTKLSKKLYSHHVTYNAQRVNARHYIKLIF